MMRKLHGLGVDVPVIGDFHYNGHKLLVEYPEMAAALAKYRINPGNVGAKRHDEHFATIVKVAIDNAKPVRIGVNWGSLDQQLLTELMNENAATAEPRDARDVMIEAMIESAMRSAELAEETGLGHDRIIISAKVSQVRDLVDVYRLLAARVDYPLPPRAHGGRASATRDRRPRRPGLAILLNEGHRRHDPRLAHAGSGAPREREVEIAQQVLQSMGHPLVPAPGQRLPRLRPDDVDVLPGDGPADPDLPEGPRCPSGRRPGPASRTCGSRSWAAS
jgi:(E)-4-hydroxy-3-methylbut-2-enyl-diphosphate synthase